MNLKVSATVGYTLYFTILLRGECAIKMKWIWQETNSNRQWKNFINWIPLRIWLQTFTVLRTFKLIIFSYFQNNNIINLIFICFFCEIFSYFYFLILQSRLSLMKDLKSWFCLLRLAILWMVSFLISVCA